MLTVYWQHFDIAVENNPHDRGRDDMPEEPNLVFGHCESFNGQVFDPLSLMSKGEKFDEVLPSMTKGEFIEQGCH